MRDILYTEWMKLKRSRLWWLVVLGPGLPVLLTFALYFNSQRIMGRILVWDDFFKTSAVMLNTMLAPAFFALLAGYVLAREYQEHTISTLLTYPRPRWMFFLGKWLILIPLVFLVFALGYFYTLGAGFALQHESLAAQTLWVHAQAFGIMAVCHVALVPLALVAALIRKSLIPAVAIGIGAVVANGTILSSEYLAYFPWTAGMALVIEFLDPNSLSIPVSHAVAILFLSFVVPFVVGLYIFYKMDVQGNA